MLCEPLYYVWSGGSAVLFLEGCHLIPIADKNDRQWSQKLLTFISKMLHSSLRGIFSVTVIVSMCHLYTYTYI